MMTTMNYENYGKKYELSFRRGQYHNNKSLAIQVLCKEEGFDFLEPFARLTVNLVRKSGLLDENCAFVDTNNDSCKDILLYLLSQKVIEDVIGYEQSGFCVYPCVRFSKEWLKSLATM